MSKQPDDLKERQAHQAARQLLTCKHFNGIYSRGMTEIACCKAGVNYREHVGGEGFAWIQKLPCTPRVVGVNYHFEAIPCDKREFPTIEEVEAEEARFTEHLTFVSESIRLCQEDFRTIKSGHITCPKCHKGLLYSISPRNGHMAGKCETPDCLEWIE